MTNPLKTWLSDEGISHSEFARRVGAASAMTVWRWAHGRRVPDPWFAWRIEEATGGAVPASYWTALLVSRRHGDVAPAH